VSVNPGTVLGQSIAASVFLVALAATGAPELTVAFGAAGLLWALALNLLYARSLGGRGRTPRRMFGDRAVARQLLISYVLPIAVGLTLVLARWDPDLGSGPFTESELAGLLAVVAVMLVAWVASSHVDWYYIRPRIDGVVTDPPCRTSGDTKWKGVTRKWYLHRAIASLTTMLAVVSIAVIVTVMLGREWPNGLAAVGGFAAIISAGWWLMRDEVASAGPTSRSIRTPRYWVGDDLTYHTDFWKRRGYVLHVAIPQTKLVPLDPETGARKKDVRLREEPSTALAAALCDPGKFAGCDAAGTACGRFNDECLFGSAREEVGRPRRWVA
jgi:hypothetical protein